MTEPAFQNARPRARGTRPRLRAVLLEQIRATGLALRWPALLAVAVIAVATLATGFWIVSQGGVVDLPAQPSVLPGLIGALLPFAVWARDAPFAPGFLWTLPVDRRQHALTRVFAGWVWLMAGIALFGLWLLALAVASGGRVPPVETLNLVTAPPSTSGLLDPAALRTIHWAPGPLIWAVPFTSATAGYLLASAVTLGTRYPFRWAIGTVVAHQFLSIASQVVSSLPRMAWIDDLPRHALRVLIEGRYGVDALLTARTTSLSAAATLTTGEMAVVWSAVPDLGHWRVATLLWTGAGLLALWAAASRHRERRRA
jgi:hypothetical protein